MYEEARQLFRRHRGLIALGGSEWPNIRWGRLGAACSTIGVCTGGQPMANASEHSSNVFAVCHAVPRPHCMLQCFWLACRWVCGCQRVLHFEAMPYAPLTCWSSPALARAVTTCGSKLLCGLRFVCSADLLELASPGGVDSRLRVAQRMMRSYTVFQASM